MTAKDGTMGYMAGNRIVRQVGAEFGEIEE